MSSGAPLEKPKAKTARTKRFLEKREPQLVEDVKQAMFLRSTTCNQTMHKVLNDLHSLKRPHAIMYVKKNTILPFDDASSLEFFSQKSDASLFAYGYHSKKRPNTILLGRFFDHHILDMIELSIKQYVPMEHFKNCTASAEGKPLFLFQGTLFDQSDEHRQLRNLLLDFYHGIEVSTIHLDGLEHVMVVTALENGTVLFRVYAALLKKSGTRLPRIELQEMGPRLDFVLGRTKFAPESVTRVAYKKPNALKPKKVKNVTRDALGDQFGRIHNPRQDLTILQTRKVKALRKDPKPVDAEEEATQDAHVPAGKRARPDSADPASSGRRRKEPRRTDYQEADIQSFFAAEDEA